MFKKILVPLDGSHLSECAIEPAIELAERLGAELVVMRVSVLPEHLMTGPMTLSRGTYHEIRDSIVEATQEYLDAVVEQLGEQSVKITSASCSGEAYAEILRYAKDNGISLIVMSTNGRNGFQRWLFGSVAERVIRGSSCPVMSIRPDLS